MFRRPSPPLSTTFVDVVLVRVKLTNCMATWASIKPVASAAIALKVFTMLIFSYELSVTATDIRGAQM